MTHIVYTSVASRLERGEYLPHRALAVGARSACMPATPSTTPTVSPLLSYVGAALLGAALALAFFV